MHVHFDLAELELIAAALAEARDVAHKSHRRALNDLQIKLDAYILQATPREDRWA